MKTILKTVLGALCAAATAAALAMGPDPGGHSGATVTPETTKTDNKQVDTARETRSPGKTENVDQSAQTPPKEKASSDASAQSNTKK